MIFEQNYYFALNNNLIEGQGLLPSYIHLCLRLDLVLKISIYPNKFLSIFNIYYLINCRLKKFQEKQNNVFNLFYCNND